jgi:microcystin-dependent protein
MAGNVDASGIVGAASGGTIAGELKMWPTASAPTGYLMCDGALVSRTTYAILFGIIGTTYGPGDGSTTFNLPNFKDRMPIGAGITYSANTTGGSKDAIVVSHTHSATSTDAGHSHTYSGNVDPSGRFGYSGGGGNAGVGTPYNAGSTTASGTASISTTITSTGAAATNANLPPYIGIHFIIRTGL